MLLELSIGICDTYDSCVTVLSLNSTNRRREHCTNGGKGRRRESSNLFFNKFEHLHEKLHPNQTFIS